MKKRLISFLITFLVLVVFLNLMYISCLAQQKKITERIVCAVQTHTATESLKILKKEFEDKTGIMVIFDEVPVTQLGEKVLMDLATGSGAYDVIGIHEIWLSQYVMSGWLQSLDELIKNDKITDKELLAIDDFPDSMIDGFKYKGILYGLPFYGEIHMLFYNKELFKQAGLPDRAPKDYAELVKFARTIKEKTGKAGITLRGTADGRSILAVWQDFAFSNGWPGWFDENWQPLFHNPEAIRAIEFYRDILRNYGPKGVESFNWPEVQTTMQQGETGMIIDASNFGPRMENPELSKVAGKLGYGLMPVGEAKRSSNSLAYGLYIPKESKHKEAAWKFIQWALSKDVMLRGALIGGMRSDVTRISVQKDPKFVERYNKGNFLEVKTEAFKYGGKYYPKIKPFGEVAQEISIALSTINSTDVDAKKIMYELDEKIKKIMEKSGY